MLFGIDGDTIEERLKQAIEYIQEEMEQYEKEIQYHREEIKDMAINRGSSYIVDYMSHNIRDLNTSIKSKEVCEKQLMMLKKIKGKNK